MKNKKTLIVPLNFFFHSSDGELSSFELSRLADVANLRMQLVEVIEELVEQAAHASLAVWFRQIDRKALLDAINTTVDPIAIAKRAIRENSRTADEPKLPPLPLGNAHSAAALRYQERNIADGKCSVCPSRLARHSVRYCEKHLKVFRDRAREESKKLNKPPHGRAAGTLQALAESREHRRKKADE